MVLETDSNGLCLSGGFLRVRVEINTSQPLPKGFFLRGRTNSSRDRCISFKYEKLPDFCYTCGRTGQDNRGCCYVTRDEGERSGYGPELRIGRVRRSALLIEVIQAEVDAAEVGLQNLLLRRPEIQMHDNEARVVNDRMERVTPTTYPLNQQVLEGVGRQYSSQRTVDAVTQRPGVEQLGTTGVSHSSSLSIVQEKSPCAMDLINACGSGQITTPSLSPIAINLTLTRDTISVGPGQENGPHYYVTEPPDSPRFTPIT
ncbi:hypothetical protein Vadar_016636 [Vaccinium darrowii]|uniref:Uncharacterized protein n=1 Tax=Vaccinium darrowii TaxID=229202 RepID=A0ACB7YM29_9ERIC|nr:hypothetical protein Vadar_016636 [Vaccinium darrowii]